MTEAPPNRPRARRADALHSESRLVEAARDIFDALGPGAPLAMVARQAKVGPGTLYRHFSDRQALLNAAFDAEIRALCRLADETSTVCGPTQALYGWLDGALRHAIEIGGLSRRRRHGWTVDEGYDCWSEAALRAGGRVLTRAQSTGAARPDIEIIDLLVVLAAALRAGSVPVNEERIRYVLDLLEYGWRGRPPSEH
ncbi:transcriptional regulator [Frankia sp. EI5c]|uniref:TetR/AcrR family transcriptional regulator n=1 Tax=Frankia sp. EI5c TaxID=683316 RepID=UPI0007C403A7|nr:TetR/AcrR family transcriptional regulator [Frankia sp. EI5c]OAA20989.1 transcriptional regulator [Frankia sp. EI5c]